MDIKKLRESEAVVGKVEELLQLAYSSNQEFNAALDDAHGDVHSLSIRSLRYPGHEFKYSPSEVLFWAERKTYLDELDHWEGRRESDLHEAAIRYVKSSDQMSVLLDLVDAIRLRRVAPFVGAGLSRPCGYPMWGEALKKMADRLDTLGIEDIGPLMARYDYLQAAEVLYAAAEDRVNHFIKTEFRKRPSGVQGAVTLLPQLSHGCMVTTNFDTVIEDLFRAEGQPLDGYMYGKQPGNAFVQRLLRGERCILKLHGDASQDNTYVFTRSQYASAYGEPLSFENQLPRALRQIFISHSLLFLGCSLEQDKTLDLFQSVVDERAYDIPDHFALLNRPANPHERQQKESRLLRHKIRPLWFDTPPGPDGVPDFSLLEQILSLAIAVARGRVSLT